MRKILFVIAILSAPAFADQTMTRLAVRDESPGVQPGSYANAPKTLYLLGTGSARVEEQPSPQDGKQMVVIRADRQSWVYDQTSKTGRHQGGAPEVVHLPMWQQDGVDSMDIGQELPYLKQHHAKPAGVQIVQGQSCTVERVEQGNYTVDILLSNNHMPVEFELRGPNHQVLRKVHYDAYVTGLKAQPELFRPPAGVKIEEAG
jgi:hypothetical protein